ncbi:MAG: Phosphate acyltransferase [Verrucomicrobiales bacterium]|nr:Phosphate acyltransferase [Verrucomicrobiales bacterium]
MRIAVDAMGGDHGIPVLIEGVKLALETNAKITQLLLVGRESEIKAGLSQAGLRDSRIQIIHADDVLTMDDKPMDVLRKKKNCSMAKAINLVKEGSADSIVSRGNTGGLFTASTVLLRPIEGVKRAALATVIPTPKNEFILIDAGANVECKPLHLAHFAIMGNVYSREVLGYKSPRVGILSNGTEETKGNELTQAAHRLCKLLDLNFIGNVEGHDLFENRVEVVVCDGFVGNIVLKTMESIATAMLHWLKDELYKNPRRMMGAMLAKNAFKTIKKRMDPESSGGAPLLGLNGTVMKAHGSAREKAIMNAIRMATESAQLKVNHIIREDVARANAVFPVEAVSESAN